MKSAARAREGGRLPFDLGERFGETVRDPNVPAAELPHQLHVVVAGHAVRRAVGHHPHDEADDIRCLRSAIHEIAEEDGLAACGVVRVPVRPTVSGRRRRRLDDVAELLKERAKLVEAAMDVADHVERTVVLTAIVPERLPFDRDGVDLVLRLQNEDVTEALVPEAAHRAPHLLGLLADDVGARTVGPARPALRSWQSRSGSARTIATGRQWNSRASATRGLRASGCTLVASTTVSFPSARRLRAMKCSTSNASFVTSRSFSSSETRPRHQSDDRTSVGLKCFRAKVDLPEPDGPTSTTSASSGIFRLATAKHPHLRRRARRRVVRADRKESNGVAVASGLLGRPGLELCSRPLEPVVAVPKAPGGQAGKVDVVLDVRRRDHHGGRPGALEQHALESAKPCLDRGAR